MKRWGISKKITLGILLIVVISVLTVGLFATQLFKNYVYDSKQQNLITRAEDIANISVSYISDSSMMHGYGAFVRFLDTLAGSRIWITDRSGKLVLSSGDFASVSDTTVPEESKKALSSVLKGTTMVTRAYSPLYKEDTVEVGVPVINAKNEVVGAVFMISPMTGIRETLTKANQLIWAAILAATLFSLLIGWFLSNRLTRPLIALRNAAKEMADGHFNTRSNILQSDEIGELSASFDHMAMRLSDTVEQLFQEKAKLSDVLDSISEGLLVFDGQGTLLSGNPASLKLMGFEVAHRNLQLGSDLPLQPFLEHGQTLLEKWLILPHIQKVLDCGEPSVYLIDENNSQVLKLSLTPLRNSAGDVTGVVGLIQDISKSENLERMRRAFIANVSHELRTPITMIKGAMEAIFDGAVESPEQVADFQKQIINEANVLERLVADLLDLSKLESGKLALNKDTVDVGQLLEEAVKVMKSRADQKKIELKLSLHNAPWIDGDYGRLRQVLLIFLDNALQYSLEKTTITVSCKMSDHLEISVSDQGVGIAAEDIPYLWDRFYRADKSRNRAHKGAGLGLSIAKQIVELHGGQVALNSELGKGTTVTISLP